SSSWRYRKTNRSFKNKKSSISRLSRLGDHDQVSAKKAGGTGAPPLIGPFVDLSDQRCSQARGAQRGIEQPWAIAAGGDPRSCTTTQSTPFLGRRRPAPI